jgi:uncharacterized protein YlxP (DUF503 family)
MIVGVLHIQLSLPGVGSLKDKRRLLTSLLDRLHNQFNVAAAEVNQQDTWRRAQLAVACVSSEGRHANQILTRVMAEVERAAELVVVGYEMELR